MGDQGWIRYAIALVIVGFIASALAPQVAAVHDDNNFPDACAADESPTAVSAFPVTNTRLGNGEGNEAQLYSTEPGPEEATHQGPAHPVWVYASWRLSANTLNNEANGFSFGTEASSDVPSTGSETWDTGDGDKTQAKDCAFVTKIYQDDGAVPNFDWIISAGDWGTFDDWSCTRTTYWELSQSVHYSIQDVGGETTISVGESHSCTEGGSFDSGILFGQEGHMDPETWGDYCGCYTPEP